tara:strand:- start:516 stop:761 length:246 start_codon:yes stop_codon:yes gene_type:complete
LTHLKLQQLCTYLYSNSKNNQQQRYGVEVDEEFKVAKRLWWRVLIVKARCFWADIRGHHGHKWNYEPGDYYMGRNKNKSRK